MDESAICSQLTFLSRGVSSRGGQRQPRGGSLKKRVGSSEVRKDLRFGGLLAVHARYALESPELAAALGHFGLHLQGIAGDDHAPEANTVDAHENAFKLARETLEVMLHVWIYGERGDLS